MLNSDVFVLKHSFNRLHKIGGALISPLSFASFRCSRTKRQELCPYFV